MVVRIDLFANSNQTAEGVESEGLHPIEFASGIKGLKPLGFGTVAGGDDHLAFIMPEMGGRQTDFPGAVQIDIAEDQMRLAIQP